MKETVDFGLIRSCLFPLFYSGVLSMGVAYSLQIIGQQNMEPTAASLIMSLESVFAALCGWLLLSERMSSRELLGCALVFAAVILSQIPEKKTAVQ
jgi:drug/metabolite transporter (DMT)-like permease